MLAPMSGLAPGSDCGSAMPDAADPAARRRLAPEPTDTGTSAVEYAFLIAGILAVIVALGFAVLHVVQDGLPASCDTSTTQVRDAC